MYDYETDFRCDLYSISGQSQQKQRNSTEPTNNEVDLGSKLKAQVPKKVTISSQRRAIHETYL